MNNLGERLREALRVLLDQTSSRRAERTIAIAWFRRLDAEIEHRNREILAWLDSLPESLADSVDPGDLSSFWTRAEELLHPSGSTLCSRISFLLSGLDHTFGWLKREDPVTFAKLQSLVGTADHFPMKTLSLYTDLFDSLKAIRYLSRDSNPTTLVGKVLEIRRRFRADSERYQKIIRDAATDAGVTLLSLAEYERLLQVEEANASGVVVLGDEVAGTPAKAGKHSVFLSYAREDADRVSEVYEELIGRGVDVWFDRIDLRKGRWKPQIERAIARSRYFLICVSSRALQKIDLDLGFQGDELSTAYSIALEQSDREFTIVPVRLEDCGRGDNRLSGFQQYDLYGTVAERKLAFDRLALVLLVRDPG